MSSTALVQQTPVPLTSMNPHLESSETPTRILEAAQAILEQGEVLVSSLTSENYARRIPLVFNASIGGHYRHCLDHFASVLRGLDADRVNYDHRERDARIENDPEYALFVTRQIRNALAELSAEALEGPVLAECEVSYQRGDAPITRSSVGREIVYSIAHAIHHYALIAVMAKLIEARLPENFGVAPSTVAHLGKTPHSN